MFVSHIARIYYEGIIENMNTRLNTIDTKEKRSKHSEEITIIKMVITLLSNLLKGSK